MRAVRPDKIGTAGRCKLEKKRVLIIDDEADIREVAKMSLEAVAGWDVTTASSGPEGIEIASKLKPDAILLDYMMPGMDGPNTFQNLKAKAETDSLPVVFLTAKVQAADRQRLQQLGARGIIAKPFDPMTLADEIAAQLGWKS